MKIIVRPFKPEDKPAIEAMHAAMAHDYEQPAWDKMLLSAVVEIDGKPSMAAFLRKTTEAYMLADPKAGRKRDKLANLIILHRELLIPAKRAGIEDWHAWLPPGIEENFAKVLMHLGWQKPLWPCYSRKVE